MIYYLFWPIRFNVRCVKLLKACVESFKYKVTQVLIWNFKTFPYILYIIGERIHNDLMFVYLLTIAIIKTAKYIITIY